MGSKPDPSYIIKKTRDFDAMLRSQNATVLEEFLEQPVTHIVEAITGALAEGPKAWMAATGRIVQGALKVKLFEQFARELNDLRAKGRIPEDFAENKYGFQTWVELLSVIDSDVPDEDRLEALKAMFLAVNKTNTTDGEQIVGYRLFQIAKRLTSGGLLILKAAYEAYKSGESMGSSAAYRDWAANIAKKIGHNTVGLVDREDRVLVDEGLLTERTWSDRSGVNATNYRLMDLGILFCQNIEGYRLEVQQGSSAAAQQ